VRVTWAQTNVQSGDLERVFTRRLRRIANGDTRKKPIKTPHLGGGHACTNMTTCHDKGMQKTKKAIDEKRTRENKIRREEHLCDLVNLRELTGRKRTKKKTGPHSQTLLPTFVAGEGPTGRKTREWFRGNQLSGGKGAGIFWERERLASQTYYTLNHDHGPGEGATKHVGTLGWKKNLNASSKSG